jgi:hypothetical protein
MINHKDILRTLTECVAERGADYIYSPPEHSAACYYVHPDGPGCGAGLALTKLGIPLSDLAAVEGASAGSSAVADLAAHHGLNLTSDARIVLDTFQAHQDAGVEWGPCLEAARESVNA